MLGQEFDSFAVVLSVFYRPVRFSKRDLGCATAPKVTATASPQVSTGVVGCMFNLVAKPVCLTAMLIPLSCTSARDTFSQAELKRRLYPERKASEMSSNQAPCS